MYEPPVLVEAEYSCHSIPWSIRKYDHPKKTLKSLRRYGDFISLKERDQYTIKSLIG